MTDVIAGRFALCDPIARGGSGTVWRAFDRKEARFCAAKVLRRRDAADLLRFVREQSVRVAHPNVLAPYSWAAEDAHVVIASELVDGGSLSTLIGDWGPLAEPTVAAVLDQLLGALDQVHAAGLVHRDIKPANLLLHATGQQPLHVMVGDFGLAMGLHDAHLTEVGTVVGTVGYLAPEVMYGGVAPDVRQDLFAAGRVAVALLNGLEPRDHGPVAPDARPGPLRDLVLALTAADPAHRPTSALQARTALQQVTRDPRPRTRAGDPVEVLHQLPPLSEDAIVEARATEPIGSQSIGSQSIGSQSIGSQSIGSQSIGSQPTSSGPVRTGATAPVSPTPPPGGTSVYPLPPTRPTAGLPPDRRARRDRPRRRRGLLAAGGVLLAAAVAVPVALAVSGGDAGTPSSGTTTGSRIELGAVCSWQQQGDQERTSSGTSVVCTSREDTYLWSTP